MDLQDLLKELGTSGATPKQGGSDSPLTPLIQAIEKLGSTLNAKIEAVQSESAKRFHDLDKSVGKIRGMVKGGPEATSTEDGQASEPPKANTKGNGEADTRALFQLGELLNELPKEVRSRLKDRLNDGASIREILSVAELYTETKGGGEKPAADTVNKDSVGDKPAVTGLGATPAKTGATAHPATQLEYVNIAASDPKRFAALTADDSFDPTQLPAK